MRKVEVITIIELLKELFGDNWHLKSHEETNKAVKAWLVENNAHYYAEEKHKFSPYVGMRQAEEAGKSIVLIENLS